MPALLRTDTKLRTARDNNAEDDFALFNDFSQENDGRELAREFYEELQNRQSSLNSDETYAVSDGRVGEGNTGAKTTITVRASSRQPFDNRPTTTSSSPQQLTPLDQFFSFLTPAPRPAASAGLFSGSGTTVYSSGRSIRAEIEILETNMRNDDLSAKNKGSWDSFYVGTPEQTEEVFRLVAVSLIVLSAAYIAVEASGGGTAVLISWEDAMSLMTGATKDGMSDIMVSVGNGDVFWGEEAAWLMKESAEWATAVEEAVRSVETLVLF